MKIHPLKIYSLENKITLKEIAKMLNKTTVTIYRISEYKTKPSPKLAKEIHNLTKIPILDLLYPNENNEEAKSCNNCNPNI